MEIMESEELSVNSQCKAATPELIFTLFYTVLLAIGLRESSNHSDQRVGKMTNVASLLLSTL
jgi:hypothetical protein